MGDRSDVRVLLYLETDGEVIHGTVASSGADPREFFGWLELASELEGARTSRRTDPRDEPQTRPARP